MDNINDSDRGFFGVIIPLEILDSKNFTANEKILYGFIASFRRCCFATNDFIAARLGFDGKTVSRGLKHLSDAGYIFVEYQNNDNSKRRVYAIFDNPKKLAYLAKKGVFNREKEESYPQGFPQSGQNVSRQNVYGQNVPKSGQNVPKSGQNVHTPNGGESGQFVHHNKIRIKKEESKSAVEATGAPARPYEGRSGGAPSGMPKKADFQDPNEYEEAYYRWREESAKNNKKEP